MPPGGGGFYYFSTYLLGDDGELCHFDMTINGNLLCTARTQQTTGYFPQSACIAAAYATEGTGTFHQTTLFRIC